MYKRQLLALVKSLNKETTLQVIGVVRERSSKNPKQPTGDIEVVPSQIKVLGRCRHKDVYKRQEYCFFTGDGRRNHFTTEWKSTDCFGWTLESPYTD